MTGLAGFLLAKTAAAFGRHSPKDYYDMAFVLLHHDQVFDDGHEPLEPAEVVLQRLGPPTDLRSALEDLMANFADDRSQGVTAYVSQTVVNNPGLDPTTLATDARLAVAAFTSTLISSMSG